MSQRVYVGDGVYAEVEYGPFKPHVILTNHDREPMTDITLELEHLKFIVQLLEAARDQG